MDMDALLGGVIIFGDIFFFTIEGIQKNDDMVQQAFSDLYRPISFN
jgi:hypothetical protein